MSQKTLVAKLFEVARRRGEVGLPHASRSLMEELLSFGSETPCNMNMVRHIEFGKLKPDVQTYRALAGLKIRRKDISVAEIVHVMEDMELPPLVAERFPSLTEREWDAALRVATLVLSALEWERPVKGP